MIAAAEIERESEHQIRAHEGHLSWPAINQRSFGKGPRSTAVKKHCKGRGFARNKYSLMIDDGANYCCRQDGRLVSYTENIGLVFGWLPTSS